jgi:hypothetical protein
VKTVVYSGDNGYGMPLLSADQLADFDEVRRPWSMCRERRFLANPATSPSPVIATHSFAS